MNRTIIALAAIVAATGTALAGNYVNGYTRQDGTYVAPHYRSAPDNNRYNNYSSQGMVNPYTGRQGTQNPYGAIGSTPSNPYGTIGGGKRNCFGC